MKIAFIHSSAGPNSTHEKYALSIGAFLIPEDGTVKLYDRPSSKFKLIKGWVINAFTYFKLRKYDVIVTDSFRISVTIAKVLGILKPKQWIIIFFGSEQLIKLKYGNYSLALSYLYNLSLLKANAFLYLGIVNQQLILKLNKNVPSAMTFNGIDRDKMNRLLKVQPAIQKNVFFVMANVLSIERAKIKGIDIAISAFKLFKEKYSVDAKLIIAGKLSQEARKYLEEMFDDDFIHSIRFIGEIDNLSNFFKQCTFGLNLSRYDAWSLMVNESLLAGIPCLISENTGSKDMNRKIDSDLIVSEDITVIAEKMHCLCKLKLKDRIDLSDKCRKVSKEYTEEKAIKVFQNAFNDIITRT